MFLPPKSLFLCWCLSIPTCLVLLEVLTVCHMDHQSSFLIACPASSNDRQFPVIETGPIIFLSWKNFFDNLTLNSHTKPFEWPAWSLGLISLLYWCLLVSLNSSPTHPSTLFLALIHFIFIFIHVCMYSTYVQVPPNPKGEFQIP